MTTRIQPPGEGPVDLEVPGYLEGLRLPQFLAQQLPQLSRSTIFRLIKAGKVQINDETAGTDCEVRKGMCVTVILRLGGQGPTEALPPLDILHEDPRLILINKPAGEVVVPARHEKECPLLESLTQHFIEAGEAEARPRIVHRLDRDTSGVLLLAKTLEAQRWLTSQFMDQKVGKKYLALVEGEVREETGEVALRISPVGHRSTEMRASTHSGRESLTHYRVAERFRGYTLLEVLPKTGRTHQVRVHLAAIGYPLLVDPLYGHHSEILLSSLKRGYRPSKSVEERPVMSRTTLHASSIQFCPAMDAEPLSAEAPLPKDFNYLLRAMRKYRGISSLHPSKSPI